MKKLSILFLFLVTACATDKSVLDVQHKILAEKLIVRQTYYFKFYDGSMLAVDEATFHSFKEREYVRLTWRRKNGMVSSR